jgi:hypothetical protein
MHRTMIHSRSFDIALVVERWAPGEDDVVGGPPLGSQVVVDGQGWDRRGPVVAEKCCCCPPDVDGKQMSSVTCTFVSE